MCSKSCPVCRENSGDVKCESCYNWMSKKHNKSIICVECFLSCCRGMDVKKLGNMIKYEVDSSSDDESDEDEIDRGELIELEKEPTDDEEKAGKRTVTVTVNLSQPKPQSIKQELQDVVDRIKTFIV